MTFPLMSSDVAPALIMSGAFWVHFKMAAPLRKCWDTVSAESLIKISHSSTVLIHHQKTIESARKETIGLKYRAPAVAHAECVFKDDDGPLRLTQNQKESHSRSPCKHLLIQRLQILYRLWTLPFKLLTGVICVIVRGRSGSSAQALENSADQRCEYNSQNRPVSL